jgi:hypothetical protein
MNKSLHTPSNYQERRAARKALLASASSDELASLDRARADKERAELALWRQIRTDLIHFSTLVPGTREGVQARRLANDIADDVESAPCDRGTPGCSVVRHVDLDSECQPW